MEKRRGIKVLLFLLAFVGCFSLLPQQLWAKSKEMTISQADVYLPDISVYMETADGKACGKDEVKAKISDTGVSLTVKSSDIFSDTDRGILNFLPVRKDNSNITHGILCLYFLFYLFIFLCVYLLGNRIDSFV